MPSPMTSLATPGRDLAFAAIDQIAALNDSERVRRLNLLDALYQGKQYDGMPSFWDDKLPVRERAPHIQSRIVATAINRVVDMVIGEGKFPQLTMGASGASMYGITLSDAEAADLNAAMAWICDQARLPAVLTKMARRGNAIGSACAVVALRRGRPFVEVLDAKWCTPTLDDLGQCTSLDVRWRFERSVTATRTEHFWYRRLIAPVADGNGATDQVWRAVPAMRDGSEPVWGAPDRTVRSPFVSVVWVKNLCPDGGDDIDGEALCDEQMVDTVAALDRSLSQRDRHVLYNMDPLMLITGATAADVTGERGAEGSPMTAAEAMKAGGWGASIYNAASGMLRLPTRQTPLKRGPGKILAISKEGADAHLIETTGAGVAMASAHIDDLRRTFCDVVGVVLADPEKLGSGDLSGRALHLMFSRMIALAAQERVTWGDALRAIMGMLLRLYADTSLVSFLPNRERVRAVLARFTAPTEAGETMWIDPPIGLAWGAYFSPSSSDISETVAAATSAVGDGMQVAARRTVVQMLSSMLGVRDPEAELAEIEAEEKARRDGIVGAIRSLDEPSAREEVQSGSGSAASADQAPPTVAGDDDAEIDPLAAAQPDASPAAAAVATAAGDIPDLYEYDKAIVTVDEWRRRKGFQPWPSTEEGSMTVAAFEALQLSRVARMTATTTSG